MLGFWKKLVSGSMNPGSLPTAVETLAARGHLHEARDLAQRRVHQYPVGGAVRVRLRQLAAEVAYQLDDVNGMLDAASAALGDGADDPRLRWLKVFALARLARYEEAWQEIRTFPMLDAETEENAVLYLSIHAMVPSARLADALGIADRFLSSERVLGTFLAGQMLASRSVAATPARRSATTCSI